MKKEKGSTGLGIVYAFCIAGLFFVACNPKVESTVTSTNGVGFSVSVIDSCEYVTHGNIMNDNFTMTHKGNCKFCKQRSQCPKE